MNKIKLLVLDIETTELDADMGHIICAVAKWIGEKKIYKWRIDETPGFGTTVDSWFDDSRIVEGLKTMAAEADAIIAYYGGYGRFDVPFINTRLIANGLEPLPPVTIIDPHKTAKSKLKLRRNGLQNVCELYGGTQKGYVPRPVWKRALFGCRRSLSEILKYCEQDVLSLEEKYLKMRPLITDHPHVARHTDGNDPRTQCTACGSYDSQSRGTRRTRLFEIFRRSCNNCKSFFESHRVKLRVAKGT